jgi:hydrogenase maturation protease
MNRGGRIAEPERDAPETAAGRRILVLGYGNPGRGDDGLGPELARRLEDAAPAGVSTDSDYQLNIEDAVDLARHDIVLFADADVEGVEPFYFRRVSAASEIAFTSHSVSPASILAICEDDFGASPAAWLLGIRGYDFDFEEGLSAKAAENLEKALEFVHSLIRVWKEPLMDAKKTILTIDDDADIRAALRVVLEGAGYAVGEAINAEEGLKAVERSKPDAIIVDLMMESIDSGSQLAQQLRESGFAGPVYMLSSAGDTVRYNLDTQEMGLAGIFQKPIDPKVLLTTLNAKLGVK